jgi:hypothetical protein
VEVEFENWRSLVAPPDISSLDRRLLERSIDAMVRSAEWRDALQRYRWIDRYLAGDAFAAVVETEEARVRAVLAKLGIGPSENARPPGAGLYPILVLAGLAFWGASAALQGLRGPRPSKRAGAGPGWRAAALIAAGIALDLALMEPAGFVIASAALFWLTARAFDERHPIGDALFAVGISAGAYLLFVRVLNVTLPAGPLGRWF